MSHSLKEAIANKERELASLRLQLDRVKQEEASKPRVWLIKKTWSGDSSHYVGMGSTIVAAYSTRAKAEENLIRGTVKVYHYNYVYSIEEHILDNKTAKDYRPPPSP